MDTACRVIGNGQEVEQVMRDIDRDRFMTPQGAVAYGLIDGVMEMRGDPVSAAA